MCMESEIEMKLSSQEINKLSIDYNLGKVRKFSLINGGAINYNYYVLTNEGEFIIRILGTKLEAWKKKKLKLEFRTLEFLRKNNFPYETPEPVKNNKGMYLSRLNGENIWVYRRLGGEIAKKVNPTQMKEIARAIAIYHKIISRMKIKKKKMNDSWVFNNYSEMKKSKIKNKVDKFMFQHLNFMQDCLNKSNCQNFTENILVTHSDLNRSNLLFNGNKLTGILDFDNVEIAPKVKDIAYAIRRFCYMEGKYDSSREKAFFNEYAKINPLSKKEKKMILSFMIRDCCVFFWWAYASMKKLPSKRYDYLGEAIEMNKKLARRWK